MLCSYFDDSGTHKGSPAVAVAAYLSTAERWRAFKRDWKQSLDVYGIEFFHMTDFASRQKQFRDWPREKCGPRLAKLIATINRNVMFSAGTVVPAHLYDVAAAIDARATPSPSEDSMISGRCREAAPGPHCGACRAAIGSQPKGRCLWKGGWEKGLACVSGEKGGGRLRIGLYVTCDPGIGVLLSPGLPAVSRLVGAMVRLRRARKLSLQGAGGPDRSH